MNKLPLEILEKDKNMIYSIAVKFKNVIEIEDAFQAGVLGLIKAYNNFNKKSDSSFSSYAYMYIYGEIVSAIKDNRNIKVSDEYFKIYKSYEKCKMFLLSKNGKEPSMIEIASFMNIDPSYLSDVISKCSFTVSLNIDTDGEEYSYLDLMGEDNSEIIDNIIDLKMAIRNLSNTDRKLIILRYMKDYTQSKTASVLNMSQVEVSRRENSILKKINNYMKV